MASSLASPALAGRTPETSSLGVSGYLLFWLNRLVRLGSTKIDWKEMIKLISYADGLSIPGGVIAGLGDMDETGHLEVKVGYLPASPINDWLNAALVVQLTVAIEEVRTDDLRDVIAKFEDQRSWYERASARLKSLFGL